MPVLESPDGTLLKESRMIADFAINMYPNQGMKLWPHELNPGNLQACQQTANHQCALLDADKLLMAIWKPFMNKFTDNELIDEYVKTFEPLEEFFKKNMNGKDWLSGHDQPMYIDIHVYPICEILIGMKDTVYKP